jgi:hypothetical protein
MPEDANSPAAMPASTSAKLCTALPDGLTGMDPVTMPRKRYASHPFRHMKDPLCWVSVARRRRVTRTEWTT